MTTPRRIIVTHQNYDRLSQLVESRPGMATSELLDLELSRADLVPSHEVPPDVVTLNSRVLFEESATGRRREVQLVEPELSDWAKGRISVLAPVGVALLGLAVGETIVFPMPGGTRRLRVVAVLFQPEAAYRDRPPQPAER